MKLNLTVCSSLLLLTPLLVQAGPVLITGTPADEYLSTPQLTPSPNLGGILLTFSTLTDGTVYTTTSPYTSQGVTISSPGGLEVEPYSTQSNPNYLVDLGGYATSDLGDGDGSANTTISVASGVTAIGFGIADSDTIASGPDAGDPVPIVLQALGAGDVDLGSAFTVTIPENTDNPGNGYFVLEDTTPDIYGVEITEAYGDTLGDYSGLAVADVQVSPEPASFVLLFGGLGLIGVGRLRKKV